MKSDVGVKYPATLQVAFDPHAIRRDRRHLKTKIREIKREEKGVKEKVSNEKIPSRNYFYFTFSNGNGSVFSDRVEANTNGGARDARQGAVDGQVPDANVNQGVSNEN